MSEAMQRR